MFRCLMFFLCGVLFASVSLAGGSHNGVALQGGSHNGVSASIDDSGELLVSMKLDRVRAAAAEYFGIPQSGVSDEDAVDFLWIILDEPESEY